MIVQITLCGCADGDTTINARVAESEFKTLKRIARKLKANSMGFNNPWMRVKKQKETKTT